LLDTHEVAKLKQEYHGTRLRDKTKARPSSAAAHPYHAKEFCTCVRDAFGLRLNVLVGVHFEHLDKDLIVNHSVMSCASADTNAEGEDSHGNGKSEEKANGDAGPLAKRLDRLRDSLTAKGSGKMTIDVWCFDLSRSLPKSIKEHGDGGFSGSVLLQLQLANVLHRTDYWQEV